MAENDSMHLTLDDLKFLNNKPLRMKFGLKNKLLKETGVRQAKGYVVHDFDAYTTTYLFMETIAEGLGFIMPELPENLDLRDQEAEITMMGKLPKKVQAALEEESDRRKMLGKQNWSQNAIMLELLEKKLGG